MYEYYIRVDIYREYMCVIYSYTYRCVLYVWGNPLGIQPCGLPFGSAECCVAVAVQVRRLPAAVEHCHPEVQTELKYSSFPMQVCAFSRDGKQKQYVQHRLDEHAGAWMPAPRLRMTILHHFALYAFHRSSLPDVQPADRAACVSRVHLQGPACVRLRLKQAILFGTGTRYHTWCVTCLGNPHGFAGAEEVWRLLDGEGGSVYVCGDAKHMARDVHRALLALVRAWCPCRLSFAFSSLIHLGFRLTRRFRLCVVKPPFDRFDHKEGMHMQGSLTARNFCLCVAGDAREAVLSRAG